MGGESSREQMQPLKEEGVHIIVATPGRLLDQLKRRNMSLRLCKYVCLDEGDRMLDSNFEEDIKGIFSFFEHQRQTLIFSATMPKRVEDFSRGALTLPVVVNVGRAGAANLDVIQEVEYVKEDARLVYLLECLNKTEPPAVVFASRSREVDEVHEYLLLKGVEAVSVHGGKPQSERKEAIVQFKEGSKDVLVATDVAAKGLDFADIKHVINYDMPQEIETYVHRIGRTGRGGKTGVATTFINKGVDETVLLDLKHLLREAKQPIPPVLASLPDPLDAEERDEEGRLVVCAYCGGLGHSISVCPSLERVKRRQASAAAGKDGLKGGDY